MDIRKKTNVRLADNRNLVDEGMGNSNIKRKDGKTVVIGNVLLVPGMKCNLMSVGHLVEKDFSVIMKKDFMQLYDPSDKLAFEGFIVKEYDFQVYH